MKKILLILSLIIYNLSVFPQFGGTDMFIIETDSTRIDTTNQLIVKQNWIEFIESYSSSNEIETDLTLSGNGTILDPLSVNMGGVTNGSNLPVTGDDLYDEFQYLNNIYDYYVGWYCTVGEKNKQIIRLNYLEYVAGTNIILDFYDGSGSSSDPTKITINASGGGIPHSLTDGQVGMMQNDTMVASGIFVDADSSIKVDGAIYLKELSTANTDTAGYGQVWVKDEEPNELWFTDDAGEDWRLNGETDVKVGDLYGGGIVYYIDPNKTWGYAATIDTLGSKIWGESSSVSGTSVYFDYGGSSTEALYTAYGTADYAYYLCITSNESGFDDWVLPTRDDLDTIYTNIQETGLVTYPNGSYWSSSQWGSGDSYAIDMGTGTISYNFKYLTKYVIGVRKFAVSNALPEAGIALSAGSVWGESITNNSDNWNIAYDKNIASCSVIGTNTKTLSLAYRDGGYTTTNWTDLTGDGITSLTGDVTASGTGAVAATIANGVIEGVNLESTNTRVDGYVPTYDSSSGGFTWEVNGSGGTMVYPSSTGLAYFNGTSWGTSKTSPSGTIVGTTDSQTLTNKTVNGVTLVSGGSTTEFLNKNGTYSTPSGSGIGSSLDGELLYNNSGVVDGVDGIQVWSSYLNLGSKDIFLGSFGSINYGFDININGNSGIGAKIHQEDDGVYNLFIVADIDNSITSGEISITFYNVTDNVYTHINYSVFIKKTGTTIDRFVLTENNRNGDSAMSSIGLFATVSCSTDNQLTFYDANLSSLKTYNISARFNLSVMDSN